MLKSLQDHWPEYLIEAGCTGTLMISICTFGVILEHPDSFIHHAIGNPVLRRILMGIAVGLTAALLIYSPWGKRSGAHMNPSFTFTFYRLGKVKSRDAFFYVLAQFFGGTVGVMLSALIFRDFLSHPSVNYLVTLPNAGVTFAFLAEVIISFLFMLSVLHVLNHPKFARFAGLVVGILVATFISLEAPISGTSMNPARSFGSAFSAQLWNGLWIYFLAPSIGMLLAAEVQLRTGRRIEVMCAKYHHDNDERCIHCGKEQKA